MHLLVIGGTRFIGRHLVHHALDRGHRVTVFHRGRTGSGLFSGDDRVTRLTGDRDTDLSPLAEGEWDATVDTCAYVPRQVQALVQVLGERGGRHLLVSSVSAYAPPDSPGFDEDSPLAELDDPTVEEVTEATYGGLKVLCERAALDRYGSGTVVVRPTYVVGPDDYTWRFPWWVTRMARGGEVLAPGPADDPAQVIDVRDLAGWMVGLLEEGHSGAYHAVSPAPPFSWRDELEAVRDAVAPEGTRLTWVSADFLREAGVDASALPLWAADDPAVLTMAADPGRATATGLRPRPLADTVRDTLAWARTVPQPDSPGLSAEREAELLAAGTGGAEERGCGGRRSERQRASGRRPQVQRREGGRSGGPPHLHPDLTGRGCRGRGCRGRGCRGRGGHDGTAPHAATGTAAGALLVEEGLVAPVLVAAVLVAAGSR